MATRKKDSTKSAAASKSSNTAEDFEKLGVFYLGRPYDMATKQAIVSLPSVSPPR